MNKGFSTVFVVLIAVAIGAAGYFLFIRQYCEAVADDLIVCTRGYISKVLQKSEQSPVSPVGSSGMLSPTTHDDTRDWKTYRNDRYGVTFRYPQDFVLTEHAPGSGESGYAGDHYAYYSIGLIKENGPGISVILAQPNEMTPVQIAKNCNVVGAANPLKTMSTPVGIQTICEGEHNPEGPGGSKVVFYGTNIPSDKPHYSHEVSIMGGAEQKDVILSVFEGLLSTFKFTK